jgi:hypothetical protein
MKMILISEKWPKVGFLVSQGQPEKETWKEWCDSITAPALVRNKIVIITYLLGYIFYFFFILSPNTGLKFTDARWVQKK